MSRMMAHAIDPRHRVNGEIERRMAKASLPKGEMAESRADIGGCLDYARREVGWTVDRLAQELKKDPKQVARWIRNEETVQVHAVFGVPELRQPFVIALAQLAGCRIETTIHAVRVS